MKICLVAHSKTIYNKKQLKSSEHKTKNKYANQVKQSKKQQLTSEIVKLHSRYSDYKDLNNKSQTMAHP